MKMQNDWTGDNTVFYDIERYKGRLMINKNGDVYSLISHKCLKPVKMPNGYIAIIVMLKNPRRSKTEYLHRLIAETFIPNPEGKKTVNHKDGDKTNNSLYNLEWATQSENNKHAIDHQLRSVNISKILERNRNLRVFTNQEVLYIRQQKGFKTAREIISELHKGSVDCVQDIWRGKTYKDIV